MTEGIYEKSFGFSTSKDYKTGVRFAMGHLVVCSGQENYRKAEFQRLLSDRIVVGAARADFFVDTNRLKLFSPQFSSQYPRQSEVVGIGAQDPESIMIVQRLNAKGTPIRTWVRNPNQPTQIWTIDGDYAQKLEPWHHWKAQE